VSTKAIGVLLGHAPGSRMADLTYSVLNDEALADAVGRLDGVSLACVTGTENSSKSRTDRTEAKENGAQVIDLKRRNL
jgi:hypothetical protein